MAKRDDKGTTPTRRVYKSSDVHRRRVGDKARSKPAKMPSKREARESARESMRISAEVRANRARKSNDAADAAVEETLEHGEPPAVAADAKQQQRPQFTVIRSKAAKGEEGARSDSRTEQSAEAQEPPRGSSPAPRVQHYAQDGHEVERQRLDQGGSAGEGLRSSQNENAGGEVEPEQSSEKPRRRSVADAAPKLPRLQPKTIALAAVMIVAVLAISVFVFNRWGRYDDHADLQGTWYVLGTEVPIEIDAETIKFNDEVSYHYEIDAREKTIAYTFGPMSGQGRYWFSDDRKHLVITDGDGYTAANTTVDDLVHAFLDFSTATGGGIVELPQGEGIIAFSREPEPVPTNQPAEGLVAETPVEGSSAEGAAAESAAAEDATAEGASAEDLGEAEQPQAETADGNENPQPEGETNMDEAANEQEAA